MRITCSTAQQKIPYFSHILPTSPIFFQSTPINSSPFIYFNRVGKSPCLTCPELCPYTWILPLTKKSYHPPKIQFPMSSWYAISPYFVSYYQIPFYTFLYNSGWCEPTGILSACCSTRTQGGCGILILGFLSTTSSVSTQIDPSVVLGYVHVMGTIVLVTPGNLEPWVGGG